MSDPLTSSIRESYDRLAEEYKFEIVDASADAEAVCDHLKKKILEIIEPVRVPAPEAKLPSAFAESLADRIFANLNRGSKDAGHRGADPFPMTPAPVYVPLSRGNGSGPRA